MVNSRNYWSCSSSLSLVEAGDIKEGYEVFQGVSSEIGRFVPEKDRRDRRDRVEACLAP